MKIYYHCEDLDGLCSGAIIYHKYKTMENIELIPVVNSNRKLDRSRIANDELIFIVDCSFENNDMIWLRDNVENVFWIDHHKTAINDSKEHGFEVLDGVRDTKSAACELTWSFIHHGIQIPFCVLLLGRYDVWDHTSFAQTLPFQYGMKSRPHSIKSSLWVTLFDNDMSLANSIVQDGNAIIKYREVQNKELINSISFEISDFYGYKARAINVKDSSYLFDALENKEDYDIFIMFRFVGDKWKIDFRTDKDIDVSEIAEMFEGGGHKGAAGCVSTKLTDVLPLDNFI